MAPHLEILIQRDKHAAQKQQPLKIKIKVNACNVCVNNRHDHANTSLFPFDSLFSLRPTRFVSWTHLQFPKIIRKIILKRISLLYLLVLYFSLAFTLVMFQLRGIYVRWFLFYGYISTQRWYNFTFMVENKDKEKKRQREKGRNRERTRGKTHLEKLDGETKQRCN